MAVAMVASYIALLPPVFDGLQILWMCVVANPIIAVALVSAHVPQVLMEVMPDKNKDHLKDIRRYFAYFAMRFVPSALVAVAVFATALHGLCEAKAPGQCNVCSCVAPHAHAPGPSIALVCMPCSQYFGATGTGPARDWTQWSGEWREGLALAQNTAAFVLVLYFGI